MTIKPLNISLPQETFDLIEAGKSRVVTHKGNPRIDRYFAAKTPDRANIKCNGKNIMCAISRVEHRENEWRIHLGKII